MWIKLATEAAGGGPNTRRRWVFFYAFSFALVAALTSCSRSCCPMRPRTSAAVVIPNDAVSLSTTAAPPTCADGHHLKERASLGHAFVVNAMWSRRFLFPFVVVCASLIRRMSFL
nr:hypothetical protein [Pandoravirus massiliensis]